MKARIGIVALALTMAPIANAATYVCSISDGITQKQDYMDWNYLKTVTLTPAKGSFVQVYLKGNLSFNLSDSVTTNGPKGPTDGDVVQLTVNDMSKGSILTNATTDIGNKLYLEDYQNQVAISCSPSK